MNSTADCIANIEMFIEEFDITDEEKALLNDAAEYLSIYESSLENN
jgi:hypothetical protein